ncbi:Electron transfer flavoprotein subunit beta [compost metagenome]
MKAKRKPLESASFADLGVEPAGQTRLLGVMAPAPRRAGIMVGSVDELLGRLKNEAKVIP